jgi:hypothetical protein
MGLKVRFHKIHNLGVGGKKARGEEITQRAQRSEKVAKVFDE